MFFNFLIAAGMSARLSDGDYYFGRLEVEHQSSWGPVCEKNFGATDGNVACKHLGFPQGMDVLFRLV